MKYYFVDTSYLLEFLKVPGRFDPTRSTDVTARFKRAWAARDSILVHPLCFIEVGNHIGHLREPDLRKRYAQALRSYLGQARSSEGNPPFTILHRGAIDFFPLLEAWAAGEVSRGLGPVDAAVKRAAHTFKRERLDKSSTVHIWTTDLALKREEPDTEE